MLAWVIRGLLIVGAVAVLVLMLGSRLAIEPSFAQAPVPTLRYLVRHADISPQSRGSCPGDRWVASGRFQALAEALGLMTVGS